MRKEPFIVVCWGLIAAVPAVAALPGAPDVVNPGTTAWFQAAKTSRADMLILGDSVVLHGGDGWDAGFITALNHRVGLAGTGLQNLGGLEGEGYGIAPIAGSPFQEDPSSAPTNRLGYVWRNRVETAGSTPIGTMAAAIANTTIPAGGPFDWHVYTASSVPGSISAYSRLGESPWTVQQTLPPVSTSPNASGLQDLTFHFDAEPAYAGKPRDLMLDSITNTSIFYSRLLIPGAKGATATSWGYGGHSVLGFYNDIWNGQGVTPEGRKQWFDALTSGGSGKLNVVITEGFNDRNETSPSLSGITPGNSPAAFADNLEGLIEKVQSDWTAAGRDVNDLSFTLVGMYEDGYEAQADATAPGLLHQYAQEEASIAAGDMQISFVDLLNHAPSYDEAVQLGYMYDMVHPSREGAMVYSQMVVDSLLPEPATLPMLLPLAAFALAGRRRRQAHTPLQAGGE